MSAQPVIRVKGVTKEFVYWKNQAKDLKKLFIQFVSKSKPNVTKHTVTILDNVSFDIFPGEFVGIMGRNGVGKSTIMKIISGIYTPNKGSVEINGKVAPVLELGAGFSEELSGFENIFLNAAILNFGKKRVDEVLESIIEFSELGEHIHAPVRNYSSGMLVRLAFSIACHLDAPILLFDEILAVGDLGFQKKCLAKIQELFSSGKAIVLVTHSPEQVKTFCTRCILFENQKIVFDGSAAEGATRYENEFN